MRINIEASIEELAEIIANGINIGDLPEAIIVAIDDCLSLPGYSVTVNEPSAIQAQLVEALVNIAEPANAGCGCHFPCRCDSEGAEAINAASKRNEAQEALATYYAATGAQS